MKTAVEQRWPFWRKFIVISLVTLFSFLLLIFLTVWVVFPLVFMNSKPIQSFFMFMNTQKPKDPEFDHPEKYGINGVINFYITTKDIDDSALSIGVWMILPETEKKATVHDTFNGSTAAYFLESTTYPILLYLHGVACNRISSLPKHGVARKHFMVIAVDHRGYGDSGVGLQPSELGIVSDTVQIYQWIRSLTKNQIYIWGHSLGAALATHSVKSLKDEDGIVPTGLILESTFTTMREEVASSTIGKFFKWLLYFEQTVQKPLEKNGFLFDTSNNILSVNCPIMIMHAEDDNVVPCFLGKKLSEIASRTRKDVSIQGNVTYYQFAAFLGYKHDDITNDPQIPQYIELFKAQCQEQNKSMG